MLGEALCDPRVLATYGVVGQTVGVLEAGGGWEGGEGGRRIPYIGHAVGRLEMVWRGGGRLFVGEGRGQKIDLEVATDS